MTMNEGNQQPEANPLSFARSYQLEEALEMALKQNTIVYFETATGKTLIAKMLLRSYAHLLRKPSPYIAVFLVPTVVLVTQQSAVVESHTDLKVGQYYGEMGADYWDDATWKKELDKNEVLVMTPQILLGALRHTFLRLDQIKVLIFDECQYARGKHQYACIMTEFYHRELARVQLPRVFGMTASPIKAKASSSNDAYWKQISELESLMHSKVLRCVVNPEGNEEKVETDGEIGGVGCAIGGEELGDGGGKGVIFKVQKEGNEIVELGDPISG